MSRFAREQVLSSIRQARDVAAPAKPVAERMAQRRRGPLPRITGNPHAVFSDQLLVAGCSVANASSPLQLAIEVHRWLEQEQAVMQLTSAAGTLLDRVPWGEELEISHYENGSVSSSVVCEGYCGLAETGSLVLLSSPSSPTPLNFLPDRFICVLQQDRVVEHIEDAWDLVRREHDSMPRALNIITGPSRTADVEQTIQIGAHGPRQVHVILYQEEI
jgi:L-lactate dehydrogenase complex protein LldG